MLCNLVVWGSKPARALCTLPHVPFFIMRFSVTTRVKQMTVPSEWDKQEEEAGRPCPFPLLLHVPQPITPPHPLCWYRVQTQFTIRLIRYDEHFPLPKSESARSGMKLPILRSAALQKSSGLQDAAAMQSQQLGVARKATGVCSEGVSSCQPDITDVQMKDGTACQGGDWALLPGRSEGVR